MTTATLRAEAKAILDTMSGTQLRVASDFLEFLKSRPADAAALELLAIPGFEKSYQRGLKEIKAGKTRSWCKVRSDV